MSRIKEQNKRSLMAIGSDLEFEYETSYGFFYNVYYVFYIKKMYRQIKFKSYKVDDDSIILYPLSLLMDR